MLRNRWDKNTGVSNPPPAAPPGAAETPTGTPEVPPGAPQAPELQMHLEDLPKLKQS